MNQLEEILSQNRDKRISVVGTTCTGKSTLIKRLGIGLDMDDIIFPLLNNEEIAYVNKTPWTPEIGLYMDKLVKEKIKIEKGNPVFGTVVIPCDLIIYLDIDEETLKDRCNKRNVDFENARNMNIKINEELINCNIPIIKLKISNPKYAKDIEHVQIAGTGHPIYHRKDLSIYFELPLLESGELLFDKNIKTISNNTGDGVNCLTSNIEIEYSSLSEENKEIANKLILEGNASLDKKRGNLNLSVKTINDDTVEVVKNRILALVSNFKYQDILYGRYDFDAMSRIIEYLRITYGEDSFSEYCNGGEIAINGVINYLSDTSYMPNIIFDEDENLFWEHKSYLNKHKEYLLKQEEIFHKNI